MSQLLSSLSLGWKLLPSTSAKPIQQSSCITSNTNQPWERIDTADKVLVDELLDMYWQGVKREVGHILLTLRKWQQQEYKSTTLPDEQDNFIHGFDTFIDQVSESGRDFAARYETRRENWKKGVRLNHFEALLEYSRDIQADRKSTALKTAVRSTLDCRKHSQVTERRARMLLQSAGLLDIDKLIEYRPPEELLAFWKRPAIPQLSLLYLDDSAMPIFTPLRCQVCRATIRGCIFQSVNKNIGEVICETCYRENHHGSQNYFKAYKNSILESSIDPKTSRRICHCIPVSRIDANGYSKALFPVDDDDKHRGKGQTGTVTCGLLNLNTLVAEAKFQGMLVKSDEHVTIHDRKLFDEAQERERKEMIARLENQRKKANRKKTALKPVQEKSMVDPKDRVAEAGTTTALQEGDIDDDIPFFVKKYVDAYPFGNVHMALGFGPLVIENGVEQ